MGLQTIRPHTLLLRRSTKLSSCALLTAIVKFLVQTLGLAAHFAPSSAYNHNKHFLSLTPLSHRYYHIEAGYTMSGQQVRFTKSNVLTDSRLIHARCSTRTATQVVIATRPSSRPPILMRP